MPVVLHLVGANRLEAGELIQVSYIGHAAGHKTNARPGKGDFGGGAKEDDPVGIACVLGGAQQVVRFVRLVAEVMHARTIVERGTSADRQLARFEAVKVLGGSEHAALVAVVDEIVEETLTLPETKAQTARAEAGT